MASEETENFLKEGNSQIDTGVIYEEHKQVPVKRSVSSSSSPQSVQEMRERLEIKKLEIEISKLDKPNTNIDYFDKMLAIQQANFQQLLAMQQKQSELSIEIERLKLPQQNDDFLTPIITGLMPLLPEILKNRGKNNGRQDKGNSNDVLRGVYSDKVSNIIETTDNNKCNTTETEEEQKEILQDREEVEEMSEKEKIIENGNIEGYNNLIRKGEITLEEAYKDMQEYTPYGKFCTKEMFEKKFNEIKEGK